MFKMVAFMAPVVIHNVGYKIVTYTHQMGAIHNVGLMKVAIYTHPIKDTLNSTSKTETYMVHRMNYPG